MKKRVSCPVCGYYTLFRETKENHEICPVCYWEDDPLHLDDTEYRGSCNGQTLAEAKENYAKVGACCKEELPFIRAPLEEELPENQKVGKKIRRTLGFLVLAGLLISSILIQSRFFFGIAAVCSIFQGFRIWKERVER